MRRGWAAVACVCLLASLAACSSPQPDAPASDELPQPSLTASATPSVPAAACMDRARSMTIDEQVSMLYMGSITANSPGAASQQLAAQPVSSVILMANRGGLDQVRALTDALTAARPGLVIATDQEGGQVQRLSGPGFSMIPSARSQQDLGSQELTQSWQGWAGELEQAGVHYDLAPSADLVPASNEAANAPIGQLDRGYGNTRDQVVTNVTAVLAGMHDAGIVGSVKHFPGLGNVTVNTDFGAAHDSLTTADSDELAVFGDVLADADSVMVGSVIYDRLDAQGPAMFSSVVINDLLRERLGYEKVVISDDLGAAQALADYPVAKRGTLFLRAGGDLALNVNPASVPAMVADTRAAAGADAQFGAQIVAKAARVLQLRADAGVLPC